MPKIYLETFYSILCYVIPSHVCLNMGLSQKKKMSESYWNFLKSLSLELKTKLTTKLMSLPVTCLKNTVLFKRLGTSAVSAPGFSTESTAETVPFLWIFSFFLFRSFLLRRMNQGRRVKVKVSRNPEQRLTEYHSQVKVNSPFPLTLTLGFP